MLFITQIIQTIKLLFGRRTVFYISGAQTLPPPLSNDEELKVMENLSNGDENAREILIVHNLRLVVYIAKLALSLARFSHS